MEVSNASPYTNMSGSKEVREEGCVGRGEPELTLKDVSLLQSERIASCEESETGIAENACCDRHCCVCVLRCCITQRMRFVVVI